MVFPSWSSIILFIATPLRWFWQSQLLTSFWTWYHGRQTQGFDTRTRSVSSKYQEVILKSTLISRGSPAVYRLKPVEKEIGTIKLLTVGERDPNQNNKTILLVGETGTGKSTLINALFNYAIGVTWDDKIWFQIVEEEKKSQAESQTSHVIVYQIFGFKGMALPFSLSIIDTPGYGDTRGLKQDIIVCKRLQDLFRMKDGIREINAVALVMKASVNRLDDRLHYIFSSVMSLFGKEMENNIVVLVTHSDGVAPKNVFEALKGAKIKCAKNEKNQPVHFLFNNQQITERTEDDEVPLENAWRVTKRGMERLMTFLKKTNPQKLDQTADVLNERVHLTACIENLEERIKYIEMKQTEIKQIQEALSKLEKGVEENKNFEFEVDEPYKIKKDFQGGGVGFPLLKYYGALCCLDCEETCHYPCTIAWSASLCKVIECERCIVCSGKCHVDRHVKVKWRFVTKTRKVKKTNKSLKEDYEKFSSEKNKTSSVLEGLEEEERQKMKEKWDLLDEAYQHVMSLKTLALSINALSTVINYNFLIEKMKERGDEAKEKVKELEEMKRQADQENKSAAGYVWGKVKGVSSALTGAIGWK